MGSCTTPIAESNTSRSGTLNREQYDGQTKATYDYAMAETINGPYGVELISVLGPWRNTDDVELATLSWVHCRNATGLLEPHGSIPPIEFEQL